LKLELIERKRAEESLRQSEEEIRHLSQQLISVIEEERKRLARDLHDEFGQALTTLHFMVEALLNSMPVGFKDQKTRCDELMRLIEQLGDSIRNISSQLRPDMLDHLGLVPTLQWYIDDFVKRRQGLQIDFQAMGVKKRPSSDIEIVLYRILQEALNNIGQTCQCHTNLQPPEAHLDHKGRWRWISTDGRYGAVRGKEAGNRSARHAREGRFRGRHS
jgi:signal transduction histidine kinase